MTTPAALPVWEKPPYYWGFSPDGDYLLYSRHRDSSLLEEANWQAFDKKLATKVAELDLGPPPPRFDAEGTALPEGWYYWFRAGSDLVGWIEYLLLRQEAPPELVALAAELLKDLDGYPILDEAVYETLTDNAICEHWDHCNLSDRVELCHSAGCSVFASRHDAIPEKVYGSLSEVFI